MHVLVFSILCNLIIPCAKLLISYLEFCLVCYPAFWVISSAVLDGIVNERLWCSVGLIMVYSKISR